MKEQNHNPNSNTTYKSRKKAKAKRKRKVWLYLGISTLLFIALICLGVGLYWYYLDPMVFFQQSKTGAEHNEDGPLFEDKFDHTVNIAFLGFDRDMSRKDDNDIFRPDTIMVASINFVLEEINLVSIPRDSYVEIHGTEGYHDKINHAYAHGYISTMEEKEYLDYPNREERAHQKGMETQVNTVGEVLGNIPLHYYIGMDMEGVVEIVDHLGGVDHRVEVPIYTGLEENFRQVLEPGFHRLSGRDYLLYVRCRQDDGDFGRVERQQSILRSTLEQLPKKISLGNVMDIYNSVQNHLETNLGEMEIMALARFAFENLEMKNLNNYVLSGEADWKYHRGQNISYVVIDEKNRVEVIRKAFGVEVEKRHQISLSGKQSSEAAEAVEAINQLPAEITWEHRHLVEYARQEVNEAVAEGVSPEDIENLSRLLEAENVLQEIKYDRERTRLVEETEQAIAKIPEEITLEKKRLVYAARETLKDALKAGITRREINNLEQLYEAEETIRELQSNQKATEEEAS